MWELDTASFNTGDEFVGSRDELAAFIHAVRNSGGEVITTSHDTARIISLPAPPKVEAPQKPQLPSPFVLKEVK